MRGFFVSFQVMGIEIQGIEARADEILRMSTTNPGMKRELKALVRKAISEARKNVVKDAQAVLKNDPRQAYRAVRSLVYKQILGGNLNILSSRRRGAVARYKKPTTLTEGQRGGNRRKRSARTMQMESYQGADRGFILRFVNAGTAQRDTVYGNRGSIRARQWFGSSSSRQLDAAVTKLADEIEQLLASEFKLQ